MERTNQELTQEFYLHFNAAHSDLTSRIAQCSTAGPDVIQQLSSDFTKLRKELTGATGFLPSYDQRQCELRLKDLEASLEKLRAAAAPKPKFAFRRKATPSGSSPSSTSPDPVQSTPSPAVEVKTSENPSAFTGVTISGRSHAFLDMSVLPASVTATDLSISELDHCVVYMLPRPSLKDNMSMRNVKITALHVRDVKNSVLIMPIIEGSALLHDISRSTLVLGCHQYRMHTSTETDVYISVASNPIIEHCKGIRFAKYPRALDRLGDELPGNLAVQDFSHIRATPSPNWTVLPEDAMSSTEYWLDPANVEVDVLLAKLLPPGP